MLTKAYPISEIAEQTFEIDEFDCASCFLLIGQDKAMLIDTGVGIGDLAGAVRQLTDKPLITVITHGHVDHVGNAWQFDACYLNEKDWGQTGRKPDPRGDVTQRRRYADMIAHRQQGDHPRYPYDPQVDIREWERQPNWLPLCDGDRFDLGGGRVITAHACPGHTPGQIALLDASTRILFVGDAVNGNIMFMSKPGQPGFTSVEKAHEALKALRDLRDHYDHIYNGHHDYRPFGQPLREDVLPDAIALCQQLISGEFTPTYEKNPMVGWPDQLAVHKGITRIAYTLEGIHEPE